jgi:hypothetical protein
MRVVVPYGLLGYACNGGTRRKAEINISKRKEDGKLLSSKNIQWISLKGKKIILWGHNAL